MRNCPVCGLENADLLLEHTLYLPENLSFMPNKLNIMACKYCGMVFTSSEADQNIYNQYYDTIHAYTKDKNTHDFAEDKFLLQGRINTEAIIQKYMTIDRYVVDVGTGTGGMLSFLKTKGYSKLLGIDVDNKKKEFEELGLNFFQGDITSVPSAVENINNCLFILNGVLEHIFDVSEAIFSLKKAMKKEDVLYVMVPDTDRYLEFYDRPFRYFGIEHINHFNMASLEQLFILNGFEILEKGTLEGNLNAYLQEPEIYMVVRRKNYQNITHLKEIVNEYIKRSIDDDVYDHVHILSEKETPIAIWGVGSYLMGLLKRTDLNKCNIQFFVDNNISLQGTILYNLPILSPDALIEFNGEIVITSAAYAENIMEEIKSMALKNSVYII